MKKTGLVLSIVALGFSSPAFASTTGSVGSPSVDEDKTAVEARVGYSEADESSSQDERFRTRIHVDHGFTDVYAARIVLSGDDRKGDNHEFDAVKFENRFDLLDAESYGFDFGLRASYQHKDGDKKPSAVEVGFYERLPLDMWELRLNQIFSHDVFEDASEGVSAELRLQATRKMGEGLRLGLEGFHNFGNLSEQSGYDDQAHTIGPVLKGALFGDYKFETGYRAGISEAAPDHSVKFFVSRSF